MAEERHSHRRGNILHLHSCKPAAGGCRVLQRARHRKLRCVASKQHRSARRQHGAEHHGSACCGDDMSGNIGKLHRDGARNRAIQLSVEKERRQHHGRDIAHIHHRIGAACGCRQLQCGDLRRLCAGRDLLERHIDGEHPAEHHDAAAERDNLPEHGSQLYRHERRHRTFHIPVEEDGRADRRSDVADLYDSIGAAGRRGAV